MEVAKSGWITVERDLELSVLSDALIRAAGGEGSLVIVEGPMGIGKSRLLDEAAAQARRHRMEVFTARGGELERDFGFGVVLQLFEHGVATLDEDVLARVTRGRAALAGRLLAGGGDDGGVDGASPADEFALLHALYWLVVNLAEERPLALVVDDVHWVDDGTVRFLLYLAERVQDLPVAIVAAVRTPFRRAGGELVTRLMTATDIPPLRPSELSLDATRQLLADANLADADDVLVDACWRATGGSPLLLRELVIAMRAGGASDPEQIAALAPRSLERRILPRITGLGGEAVGITRVAAVLGSDAPLTLVATIAGHDFEAAVRATEGLLDAAVLASADPVEFAHPMMRTVVHGSIPPGERQRLHAGAATALHDAGAPPEQVARHLLQGSPINEPWVPEALQEAARAAAQHGAPQVAVGYLRSAVERVATPRMRASLLVDLGLLEAATGETTSLERFEDALIALREPQERARTLYALGQTLYRYGRHEEALETFRRGADLFAEEDRETSLRFEAAWGCAAVWVQQHSAEAGRRIAELVAAIPDDRSPTVAERGLLAALAGHRVPRVPPASEQVALAFRALEGDALLAAQGSESLPLMIAILALVIGGEGEAAERELAKVLGDARRRDDALAFAEASMVRSAVMFARGKVDEAMADAEAALDGVDHGWQAATQLPYAALALCHIDRGELDLAEEVLARAEAQVAVGMIANALIFAARAQLYLIRGDFGRALDACWTYRDMFQAAEIESPLLAIWRQAAAIALHATGEGERAQELIAEELELARAFGLPVAIAAALRVRGLLGADNDGAIADLREAVTLLSDQDAGRDRATTLLYLGARLGEGEEAREALRDAMGLANACGATALEEQARRALVRAGGRPRRASTTGVGALTPSERRIAELAAAGTTNREIAEELFVTKNTVEWHLRNVFKKLDVGSRAELKRLLAASS